MGLTIKANPNATNSEFDAKTIIHHNPQFEYEKEQHRLACSMEDDYQEPS